MFFLKASLILLGWQRRSRWRWWWLWWLFSACGTPEGWGRKRDSHRSQCKWVEYGGCWGWLGIQSCIWDRQRQGKSQPAAGREIAWSRRGERGRRKPHLCRRVGGWGLGVFFAYRGDIVAWRPGPRRFRVKLEKILPAGCPKAGFPPPGCLSVILPGFQKVSFGLVLRIHLESTPLAFSWNAR